MKTIALAVGIACMLPGASDTLHLLNDAGDALAPGWQWVREAPEAWRIKDQALEIHVQPGNLWGAWNQAKNVLVRPLPKESGRATTVASVTVENQPTHQYEQVNLVWYYDDSNMVKIGLELVDGQVSLVMGREQEDKTRTLCLTAIPKTKVQVRLAARGQIVEGYYRLDDSGAWQKAGDCELPAKGDAKISLQAYQGPEDAEHWARITGFSLTTLAMVP